MKITNIEIINFRGIKNFKSEGKNIFGSHLTVFDGENGFGKTTIFDAIEFCMTGKVKRLCYESGDPLPGDNKPSTILKNKDNLSKKSEVTITMNDSLKITRIIREDQLGLIRDEEYAVIEGNSILEELKITSDNFKDIFYIPQTNSTTLLEESGGGIKKLLNKLFNTEEEVKFRTENLIGISSVPKKIESLVLALEAKKTEIKTQKELNEHKIKSIGESGKVREINFTEIPVLTGNNWYKKAKNLYSKEELFNENNTGYINQWTNLLKIYQNREMVENFYLNRNISIYKTIILKDKENINKYISHSLYLKNLPKEYISKLDADYRNFVKFKEKLKLLDIDQGSGLEKIDILFENLSSIKDSIFYEQLKEIENKFKIEKESLNSKNKIEKEFYTVFSNLISFWEDSYKKHTNKFLIIGEKGEKISDDICPLCKSIEKEETISAQINFLKEKSGINGSFKNNTFKMIYSDLLYNELNDYTKKIKIEIDLVQSIQLLNESDSFKKYIALLEKFGKLEEIVKITSIEELSSEQFKSNSEIFNDILEILTARTKPINEGFNEISFITYTDIFYSLYKKDYTSKGGKDFLEILDEGAITNNISYFENERQKLLNHEIIRMEKENIIYSQDFEFYKNRIIVLDTMKDIIKLYSESLDLKIKKYTEEKVKNISIPVYIFNQRIVKNYTGLGVYLTNNSINIISDMDGSQRDHNPLFSLSSGQVEGLMISVMLANNINQNFSTLNSIFIDDPIQSLDDLNVLSFINLLRYQFKDKQIIISTHNNDFSQLARYKFWRLYGDNAHKNINMKERFLKNNE
ncbi:AAA family ATPase [Candidatus Gracilibacteria bacterium]|nr:AAA family ATPase [Candidatus Gracilibacteria bacterium]